jgi:hypothetical protein
METLKTINVGDEVIDAATNDDRIHVMIEKGMNVYQ